jgi:ribulose-phosphate 3-epimerase
VKIAPSILSADFARLGEAVRMLTAAKADLIHIDVMDGQFVPNLTIGHPVVKALRAETTLPFDCHLMIASPQRFIAEFLAAGADMISIHAEAEPHLHRALAMIRSGGAKAGVAINPATSTDILDDALEHCDYVVLMSVDPGFGGQKFIPAVVEKIRRVSEMIRTRRLAVSIEVDGGVTEENAGAVTRAGAEILVAGTAVFRHPHPAEAVRNLRSAATSYVT